MKLTDEIAEAERAAEEALAEADRLARIETAAVEAAHARARAETAEITAETEVAYADARKAEEEANENKRIAEIELLIQGTEKWTELLNRLISLEMRMVEMSDSLMRAETPPEVMAELTLLKEAVVALEKTCQSTQLPSSPEPEALPEPLEPVAILPPPEEEAAPARTGKRFRLL